MPLGKVRSRTLYGLSAARGTLHRYTRWRWIVATTFTVAVALLPGLDVLRFDFWSGRHVLLGEEVDLQTAAKAFAFPFLGVNIAIILVSRFLGRYLCGFVCPVGALARLGEWLEWFSRKDGALKRAGGHLLLLAASAFLTAITFSFWVDWRVFVEGSPTAIGVSSAFLVVTTAGLYALGRKLRLRFCRDFCPSGVYFAVLGPKTWNGIEFAHPETCTDCHACENVCPVDLSPREIDTAPARPGSVLYPDGLSNYANCLRCGDCVLACEGTTGGNGTPTPLRMGFLREERG